MYLCSNWYFVAIPSIWGLLFYRKRGDESVWTKSRNPFYLRSSFLQRPVDDPNADTNVAIPSIWGLLFYPWGSEKEGGSMLSQSLLFEVFFSTLARIAERFKDVEVAIPSIWGLLFYGVSAETPEELIRSQSLLFEVFFSTRNMGNSEIFRGWSQSLLFEVFFSTVHLINLWGLCRVAIPSIWGLLFYDPIPQATNMVAWSQSLLFEVFFSTAPFS